MFIIKNGPFFIINVFIIASGVARFVLEALLNSYILGSASIKIDTDYEYKHEYYSVYLAFSTFGCLFIFVMFFLFLCKIPWKIYILLYGLVNFVLALIAEIFLFKLASCFNYEENSLIIGKSCLTIGEMIFILLVITFPFFEKRWLQISMTPRRITPNAIFNTLQHENSSSVTIRSSEVDDVPVQNEIESKSNPNLDFSSNLDTNPHLDTNPYLYSNPYLSLSERRIKFNFIKSKVKRYMGPTLIVLSALSIIIMNLVILGQLRPPLGYKMHPSKMYVGLFNQTEISQIRNGIYVVEESFDVRLIVKLSDILNPNVNVKLECNNLRTQQLYFADCLNASRLLLFLIITVKVFPVIIAWQIIVILLIAIGDANNLRL
jgi:hypothetical protein